MLIEKVLFIIKIKNMEKINEESNSPNDTNSVNKKLWNRFNDEFWALFFIHLIIKFVVSQNLEITNLPLLLIGLQIIVALIMVWRVGYHSYLFSGKKLYLLKGLLGFFWFGLIGIFLAYFAVKLDYCKVTKQNLSLRNKIVVGFLVIYTFLFMVSMVYAMYVVSSGSNQTSNSSTQNEWVEIVSPDKKFSVNLPNNYELLPSDSPNSIYGCSYTASEYNDSVLYVVKYQDYQSVYDSEGIESLSSSKKLNFLKEIEITDLRNNFNITNFSSEIIKIYEYDAIRYSGIVHEDGETMNVKGVIISVDKTSYSVIVLYDPDYNHNLDRVLDSLVIR